MQVGSPGSGRSQVPAIRQWLSDTTDSFPAAHLLDSIGLHEFADHCRAPEAAAQFFQPLTGVSAAPRIQKLVLKKRKEN